MIKILLFELADFYERYYENLSVVHNVIVHCVIVKCMCIRCISVKQMLLHGV